MWGWTQGWKPAAHCLRIGSSKENAGPVLTPVFDVLRRLVGDRPAEEGLDDLECHVDSRGDAGGGDDSVLHHARAAVHGDADAERAQEVERRPVGGGAPAFEEASLGEEERAGADG